MSSKTMNERILDSVGRQNYEMYMLLTNGKEIDKILDDRSPVFQMYNYRDRLIDANIGQDVSTDELEKELQNNDDMKLKQKLQSLFLESISNSTFRIVKNILTNNTFGWDTKKLIAIHKKHKYYRIFRLLSIEYKNWLN